VCARYLLKCPVNGPLIYSCQSIELRVCVCDVLMRVCGVVEESINLQKVVDTRSFSFLCRHTQKGHDKAFAMNWSTRDDDGKQKQAENCYHFAISKFI